jgi:hypothetical protein
MFSEIAKVFSSQGVVLPGTEFVPVPGRADKSAQDNRFKTAFDQASAKLSISQEGRDKASGKQLSDDEKKEVKELKERDQEVRRHEQQHMAAGGGYVKGGASFEYETGPDGQAYAVGGHVEIDASPVQGNPEATVAKARVVQAAALAPADPSGQDRAVAAAAAQMAQEAQQEISESSPEESAQGGAQGADPEEAAPGFAQGAASAYSRASAPAAGALFSAYA